MSEKTQEQQLYEALRDAWDLLRWEGLSTRSAQARALLLDTLERYEKAKGIEYARD